MKLQKQGVVEYEKSISKSIGLALLGSVLVFPTIASASSYDINYSFAVSLTGSTRSFDGTNIKVGVTSTYTQNDPVVTSTSEPTYSCKLYRDNTWPLADDYVSATDFNTVGDDSNIWYGVGSGSYYIWLTKQNNTNVVTVAAGKGVMKNV